MSRTIAQIAATIAADLAAESPRATARKLDASDVERAIRAHLKHARKVSRTEPETVVVTTAKGGLISKSYARKHYGAQSDQIRITGRTVAALDIDVKRTHASCHGSWLMHRAIKPGQTNGRVL
jgi:tRNA 2-selenouridine synthase SelU